MKITKADFEAWLDNPVTEQFFAAITGVRDKAHADWDYVSWDNEKLWIDGRAETMRVACRSRAECAEDILNITFEEEDNAERNNAD